MKELANIILLITMGLHCLGQNQILNPSFTAPDGLSGNGPQVTDQLYDYWDEMPFWQPPKHTGTGHVGSADYKSVGGAGAEIYHTPPYCAFTGGQEYIVGEVQPGLIPGHLYYLSLYGKRSNWDNFEYAVYFSQNRARQLQSDKNVHFRNSDNPIHVSPALVGGAPPSYNGYRLLRVLFVADETGCDRITIGSNAAGGGESAVTSGGLLVDDLKLLDLGPEGVCPYTRFVQSISFVDDILMLKASEYVIAGSNVVTTDDIGPVVVGGASDITFRAGKEVRLQDGFIVEDGADFHAFIHPCECEPPVAYVGSNVTICDAAPVQLGGEGLSYQNYIWSSDPASAVSYLSDINVANPVFTPPTTGTGTIDYTLTATNWCGDAVSKSIRIRYTDVTDDDAQILFYSYNSDPPYAVVVTESTAEFVTFEVLNNQGTVIFNDTQEALYDFEPGYSASVGLEMLSPCEAYSVRIRAKNLCSSEWSDPLEIEIEEVPDGNLISTNTDLCMDCPGNTTFHIEQTGFVEYDLIIMEGNGGSSTPYYAVNSEPISSYVVSLWNGYGNNGPTHGVEVPDEQYFYFLDLYDCDGEITHEEGLLSKFHSSGRLAAPDSMVADEIELYNPSALPVFFQFKNSDLEAALLCSVLGGEGTEQIQTMALYSLEGRLINLTVDCGRTCKVDLSVLNSGIYIAKAITDSGLSESYRFVKN